MPSNPLFRMRNLFTGPTQSNISPPSCASNSHEPVDPQALRSSMEVIVNERSHLRVRNIYVNDWGFSMSDGLTATLQEAKTASSNIRYILIKIESSKLSVAECGNTVETFIRDMDHLAPKLLNPKKPSYLLLFNQQRKVLLITHIPDCASVPEKKRFVGSKEVVVKNIGPDHLADVFSCSTIEDCKYSLYTTSSSSSAGGNQQFSVEAVASKPQSEQDGINYVKSKMKSSTGSSWLSKLKIFKSTSGKTVKGIPLVGLART
jgi:hypothetical protein